MDEYMEKKEGDMWSEAQWREGIEYVIEGNRLMVYIMALEEKMGLSGNRTDYEELTDMAMKKAKKNVDKKISCDTNISKRVKMYGAEAEKILEEAFKKFEVSPRKE